jgi:flagellar assembly factor FliW
MTTMIAQPPASVRELHFVEPMPGFDDTDSFTLTAIDPRGLLYAMRSVRAFFADYQPDIADEIGTALEAAEVEVLVVLSITSGLHDATANLRAPIVLAPSTGRAVQVILEDESLPMRRPLLGT